MSTVKRNISQDKNKNQTSCWNVPNDNQEVSDLEENIMEVSSI